MSDAEAEVADAGADAAEVADAGADAFGQVPISDADAEFEVECIFRFLPFSL